MKSKQTYIKSLSESFKTSIDSSFTEKQIRILDDIFRDSTIICEVAYQEGKRDGRKEENETK